jgi:mono/diheme cytochrome c family protein
MAHSSGTAERSRRMRLPLIGGAMLGASVVAAAATPVHRTSSAPPPPTPPSTVGSPRVVTGRGRARPTSRTDSTDHLAVNAVVYNGWKMFEVYCTRCHGEDAVGSSFAPALIKSVGPSGTIDHKAFFITVTGGRPGKGMPTWGNLLSPEQKEDIWNYLRARAVGGLAPGRPHLKPGAKRDSTVLPPNVGRDTTWPGPTS